MEKKNESKEIKLDKDSEKLRINGNYGEYIEIPGVELNILSWDIGEVELGLVGSFEKAEMLKIAESIKEKG